MADDLYPKNESLAENVGAASLDRTKAVHPGAPEGTDTMLKPIQQVTILMTELGETGVE